jgi:hypothetical protein
MTFGILHAYLVNIMTQGFADSAHLVHGQQTITRHHATYVLQIRFCLFREQLKTYAHHVRLRLLRLKVRIIVHVGRVQSFKWMHAYLVLLEHTRRFSPIHHAQLVLQAHIPMQLGQIPPMYASLVNLEPQAHRVREIARAMLVLPIRLTPLARNAPLEHSNQMLVILRVPRVPRTHIQMFKEPLQSTNVYRVV